MYVDNASLWLDVRLCIATIAGIANRSTALAMVARILEELDADPGLLRVSRREDPLEPMPVPPSLAAELGARAANDQKG